MIETPSGNVHAPVVQLRTGLQGLRIGEGVENGTISPADVTQLQSAIQAFRTQLATDKSHGPLTDTERQQLEGQLNNLSKTIFDMKHPSAAAGAAAATGTSPAGNVSGAPSAATTSGAPSAATTTVPSAATTTGTPSAGTTAVPSIPTVTGAPSAAVTTGAPSTATATSGTPSSPAATGAPSAAAASGSPSQSTTSAAPTVATPFPPPPGVLNTPYGPVYAPVMDPRLALQAGRIGAGVISGTISNGQAQQLLSDYAAYGAQLGADKQSGSVSGQQRLQLNQQLDGISQQIYTDKHPTA